MGFLSTVTDWRGYGRPRRRPKARVAVAAASGLFGSGGMQIWHDELGADMSTVISLESKLPDDDADYSRFAESDLEAKLVEVHALFLEAERLSDKYKSTVAADDKEREQIRMDMRRRTGPDQT